MLMVWTTWQENATMYTTPSQRKHLADFVRALPKAELHLHIEGTLEPELMFKLARKHGVELPWPDVEAVRRAYQFADLQSFLDLYYAGASVLRDEDDFYALTWEYLKRVASDGAVHVEIFFDPQTHTQRGVPLGTVFSGIGRALKAGVTTYGLNSRLILCFLRHLSAEDAMETLEQALPWREHFIAVGLDSSEQGNPPDKFAAVFARARKEGLLTVAHAGEEGPPEYIRQALEVLQVSRIDHGVRCEEDAALMDDLKLRRMPLTVCPLSNVKLQVFPQMEQHNLKRLLEKGLCVCLNSDDPAYFGGYLLDNYVSSAVALHLGYDQLAQLAANSIRASFISDGEQQLWLSRIDELLQQGLAHLLQHPA